jgi:hypothetical protein
MPDSGDCIWSWFGKTGNLPGLERIDELLVEAFVLLVDVLADVANNRE